MNEIYKKVGKRYAPIGIEYDRDYLNNGIWIVRNKGNSITSYDYTLEKLGDIPKITISDVASLQEYIDYAMKRLDANKPMCIYDIVSSVVGSVFEMSKK